MGASLPFLTLPDPPITGEGALDPLGLSTVGDHLANQILPGLRARMSRPRFITAIAVSAAVCEGLQDRCASDGVTPAYLVFEWLLVEAFVRASNEEATRRTPGIQKARDARQSGDAMCARTYLKTPSVFGFHGVYKPIARHLGIVDDDLQLSDRGYDLLKVWQAEQGMAGFLDSASGTGPGRAVRQTLRSAVEDGLAASRVERSGSWQGWGFLAQHLAPSRGGASERAYLEKTLADREAAPRGEVFTLLRDVANAAQADEAEIVDRHLIPRAGQELAARLKAIAAFEKFCGVLEEAFDWICYLSTHSQARPIDAAAFAKEPRIGQLAKDLPAALAGAETALSVAPLGVQQLFAALEIGRAHV